MSKSKWGALPGGKFRKGFNTRRVTTSLDLSDPAQQSLVDQFVMDRRSNVEYFVGRKVVVRDVIYIAGEGDFEESEDFSDRPGLALIMNTGETLKTGSVGMINAVRQLIGQRGDPPWEGDISLEVVRVNLKGGWKTYDLRIAGKTTQAMDGGKVNTDGSKRGRKATASSDAPS